MGLGTLMALPGDQDEISRRPQPDGPGVFTFAGDLGRPFQLDDDDTTPSPPRTLLFIGLAPGIYRVTETPFPEGWGLSSIECEDPDGGTRTSTFTSTATIDLDGGETVRCTFFNSRVGSIEIKKVSLDFDSQPFKFNSDKLGTFTLDVDLDPTTLPSGKLFSDLPPGAYNITEEVPEGWRLDRIICLDRDEGTQVVQNTAFVDLDPGESILCLFVNERVFRSVPIDIKPNPDSNAINPNSRGKIPVAILSTPEFDSPTNVDRESLTFGATGDEESLDRRGKDAVPNCGVEEVNGDDSPDLVCHFETQKAGFQDDSLTGILKGNTFDGTPIIGEGPVTIVPPRK